MRWANIKPSPHRGEGVAAYAATDEGASFRPLRIYEAGGSGTRPYGAISVLGDAMAAAAMEPRLSLRDQKGLLKTP